MGFQCSGSQVLAVTSKGFRLRNCESVGINPFHENIDAFIKLEFRNTDLFNVSPGEYLRCDIELNDDILIFQGLVFLCTLWENYSVTDPFKKSLIIRLRKVNNLTKLCPQLADLMNWENRLREFPSCKEAYHDWLIENGYTEPAKQLLPHQYSSVP